MRRPLFFCKFRTPILQMDNNMRTKLKLVLNGHNPKASKV